MQPINITAFMTEKVVLAENILVNASRMKLLTVILSPAIQIPVT
jgi:hypothetical protein